MFSWLTKDWRKTLLIENCEVFLSFILSFFILLVIVRLILSFSLSPPPLSIPAQRVQYYNYIISVAYYYFIIQSSFTTGFHSVVLSQYSFANPIYCEHIHDHHPENVISVSVHGQGEGTWRHTHEVFQCIFGLFLAPSTGKGKGEAKKYTLIGRTF